MTKKKEIAAPNLANSVVTTKILPNVKSVNKVVSVNICITHTFGGRQIF